MKVIPLDKAIKLLEQCSAVIWDDNFLSYPSVNSEDTDESDHTFLFLSANEDGNESQAEFQDGDNKTVSIVTNSMFLQDTNGNEVQVTLLVPQTL